MGVDAITVSPYMGRDSLDPFLYKPGNCIVVLVLTSNKGSNDFQMLPSKDGQPLYKHVLKKLTEWYTPDQVMFVVGATHPEQLSEIRAICPDYFFLVPGVGTQGGSLKEVAEAAMNKQAGLLVNSSRSIIYAGDGKDFAERAREKALELQLEMAEYLKK